MIYACCIGVKLFYVVCMGVWRWVTGCVCVCMGGFLKHMSTNESYMTIVMSEGGSVTHS